MKSNELRIGNLYNYLMVDFLDKRQSWKEESLIDIEDLTWLLNNPDDPNFEPIPITEKWLARFGFKFGIKLEDLLKGKHQYVQFGSLNGYYSKEGIFYFGVITKLKHVHQLQNLYFALTGEELILDLKS
jgi:hypothetical protein